MGQKLARSLQEVIDREAALLRAITEEQAAERPAREGWSRKEELGHLIDSATNNHVRFVRAALEPVFSGPTYDGDAWVGMHGYGDLPWATLTDFWQRYNSLLVHLIGRIPAERLATHCTIGGSVPVTLEFVIHDYILHMQHHLDHILGRAELTQYPGAALGT